ncbi:MAG: hypothetical protein HLX50_01480 [Alteromonadaceae bacterium]|nr:hypothetical protein [Alteromonadaceae bacterium]
MRYPVLIGILFFSTQAHCDTSSKEGVLQIAETANFITRTSLCHTLASELNKEPKVSFSELTNRAIRLLTDAGWSSQDLAEALTVSQDSLTEIPSKPEETRSDYLRRLFDSEFECNELNQSHLGDVAASIPEKPTGMR